MNFKSLHSKKTVKYLIILIKYFTVIRLIKQKVAINYCLFYLFACFTYCSMAIVMDGAPGVGAGMSSIRPASSTAL